MIFFMTTIRHYLHFAHCPGVPCKIWAQKDVVQSLIIFYLVGSPFSFCHKKITHISVFRLQKKNLMKKKENLPEESEEVKEQEQQKDLAEELEEEEENLPEESEVEE